MIENKNPEPNTPSVKPVTPKPPATPVPPKPPVAPVAPVAPVKPVVEKKKTEAEIKAEKVKDGLLYLRDNVLQGNPAHVAKIDEILKLVS
jgi:hypothetical protein